MPQKEKEKFSKLFSQAEQAMKTAIKKLIRQHKQSGHPMIIWRNGKVVKVPAYKLN